MSRRRTAIGLLAALALGGGAAGLSAAMASDGDSGSAGDTVPTQPAVTTATTPALPATGLPGDGRPTVALGDMNTPEQFIIGELYKLALEQQGYSVTLTQTGRPSIAQQALKSGTLDLYPQYLDAWNSGIAGLNRRFPSVRASFAAGSAYARSHGSVLLPPTPFSDTAGIGVSTQYAAENHVHSLADLAHGTEVAIGIPLSYESSPHGLPALVSAYHLRLGYEQTNNFVIGQQYTWLDAGDVQAVYINTTDPELAAKGYTVLRDPKHVFGFGNVVPVTTPAVLRAEGPAFSQTINRVDRLLTLRVMRGLNAEVALDQADQPDLAATKVAQEFLQGNGILPASRFAPVSSAGGS